MAVAEIWLEHRRYRVSGASCVWILHKVISDLSNWAFSLISVCHLSTALNKHHWSNFHSKEPKKKFKKRFNYGIIFLVYWLHISGFLTASEHSGGGLVWFRLQRETVEPGINCSPVRCMHSSLPWNINHAVRGELRVQGHSEHGGNLWLQKLRDSENGYLPFFFLPPSSPSFQTEEFTVNTYVWTKELIKNDFPLSVSNHTSSPGQDYDQPLLSRDQEERFMSQILFTVVTLRSLPHTGQQMNGGSIEPRWSVTSTHSGKYDGPEKGRWGEAARVGGPTSNTVLFHMQWFGGAEQARLSFKGSVWKHPPPPSAGVDLRPTLKS